MYARAQLCAARALVAAGRRPDAMLRLGLALASPTLPDAERCRALVEGAELHWMGFDIATSMVMSTDALALARRLDDRSSAVRASAALARSIGIRGDVEAGLAHARAAARYAETLDDDERAVASAALGAALINGGRFAEGLTELTRCRMQAESAGDAWTVALLMGTINLARFQSGDWAHLGADADAVAGINQDTGGGTGVVLTSSLAGMAAIRQGDGRGVAQQLARARMASASADSDPAGVAALLAFEALVHERDREFERAADRFDDLMGALAAFGPGAVTIMVVEAVRVALTAGRAEQAARHAAAARQAATQSRTLTRFALAEFCESLVSDDADALERAAEAVALTERRWEAAIAYEAAAKASRIVDVGRAERLALEAAIRFRALGCGGRAREILQKLAAAQTGPSELSAADLTTQQESDLSAAEERVLGFVAQGLSNAEIAAQQFLSKRTVESHVSSLYRKLGVETRVALAVAARTRQRTNVRTARRKRQVRA